MSTPLPNPRLKTNWTDLEYYTNKIFTEDFSHLDGITYGVQGVSNNGSSFAVAESLYFRDNWRILDRLNLRIPVVRDKTVEAYLDNDNISLRFNHGITLLNNRPFFFYGGLGCQKDGSQPHIKLGVFSKNKNCHSDNRIKAESDLTFTWYHKTILKYNEFRLGFLGVVNLTQPRLLKKDLFVGYLKDKFEIYLRGEQAWNKPTQKWNSLSQYFDRVYATGIFKRNHKETYGIEVVHDSETNKLRQVGLLVDYYHTKDNRIKAKVNNYGIVTLLIEKHFNSQLGVSGGVSLPLHKSQGRRRTRTGMRIFFNV